MVINLEKVNKKSLISAIIFGSAGWFFIFVAWLLIFASVGNTLNDYSSNLNSTLLMYYLIMTIVNVVVIITIIALYMWKYEYNNPIIPKKWALDAIIFGAILCVTNFLFDAIIFGLVLQKDLIMYFWVESVAGYFYPLLIPETLFIAYLIYGRNNQE